MEHYVDRSDFMYYRHVTFEKLTKKQLQAQEEKGNPRQILTVVDKFHPNPATPPNNDMAERTLYFAENQIKIVYQLEPGRTTASHREFIVPPMNPDQAVLLTFDPDGTTSYQVILRY
jgi:proline racemase